MERLQELNELILKILNDLFKCEMVSYTEGAQLLVNKLMEITPSIISLYFDPRMQEYASDATYWPGEIGKLIDALGKGNDFDTVDILYHELYKKLDELTKTIKKKGIEF